MKKSKKEKIFVPKPIYPGGVKMMSTFLNTHLKYPQDALDQKIEGTVRLKIKINYKGIVIGTQVLSKVNPSCDAEAIRICSLLKFEASHKLRRGKIIYRKLLNVAFTLPPHIVNDSDKETAEPQSINYQIIPIKKKLVEVSEKELPKNISYKIDID